MNIVAYDGVWFDDLLLEAGLPVDGENSWEITPRITNRGSGMPMLATSEIGARRIDVEFTHEGADDDNLWIVWDRLIGRLNPLDQGRYRKLYAVRPDDTLVWRYARITDATGWPDDDTVNTAMISFVSEDPRWYADEVTTVAPLGSGAGGSVWLGDNTAAIAIANGGQAPVHPTITIENLLGALLSGAWRYRRRQEITNTLNRTVQNMVVLISLGDTTPITTTKARADGADVRVIGPDGAEVPRKLVNWDSLGSYIYVYIASIEPGETQRYDIIYGNSAATGPLELEYPYAPAFMTEWTAGSSFAVGAGDELSLQLSSSSFTAGESYADVFGRTDAGGQKYRDGAFYFLNGANAGIGRKIAGMDALGSNVELTFTSPFPNAFNLSDDWLMLSSRNGVWMYDVANVVGFDRGQDEARGRWYLSSGESPPDAVDYTVPGAWKPYLYVDGRDKKGQARYTRLSHGGDLDSYAILDAKRTWENGAPVSEEGVADGVSLSLPFEITDYQWAGTLDNPNGMAKGFIGARGAGGNDWSELATLDTVGTGTAWSTASLTFPVGRDILQLYHGLIPYQGDEIDQSWRRDSGSSTAVGTTSTIVDSTKAWRTNQWAGAHLRFTGGRRSGLVREITSNTGTVITFSGALGTNTKEDQQYEIILPAVAARLLDNDRCTVTFDMAGLNLPALGAEETILDLNTQLWIGGGSGPTAVAGGHRRAAVEIGVTDDQFVMLGNTTESVRLSSDRRVIEVLDSGGNAVQQLTDPRVRWVYTDERAVSHRSLNGLPLPIGVNELTNPGAEAGVDDWSFGFSGTIAGIFSQDATVFALQEGGSKSFRLQVVSSTGPAYMEAVADDRMAVRPDALVTVAGFVRTTNTDIVPLIGIAFFDDAAALISKDVQDVVTQAASGWLAEGHAAIAPATAASYAPLVRANIASGSETGSVYFDDMSAGSPVLFVNNDHDTPGNIEIVFTPAWLL